MKRNSIKFGFALLCLLGGMYFYSTQSEKSTLDSLTFENIEALAGGEDDSGDVECFNYGDIDCDEIKVERKYTDLRLR